MERFILIDDLERTSLPYVADVQIVYFTLEDVEFRVDLNEAHIKEFYEALLPYLRVSRRCGGPSQLPDRLRAVLGNRVPERIAKREHTPAAAPKVKPGILKAGRTHTQAECHQLRLWAEKHGITVSDGRISKDVWAAFAAGDPEMVDPSRRRAA